MAREAYVQVLSRRTVVFQIAGNVCAIISRKSLFLVSVIFFFVWKCSGFGLRSFWLERQNWTPVSLTAEHSVSGWLSILPRDLNNIIGISKHFLYHEVQEAANERLQHNSRNTWILRLWISLSGQARSVSRLEWEQSRIKLPIISSFVVLDPLP